MAVNRFIERLLEHPAVYAAWQAPFAAQKFAPVERALRGRPIRRVLDAGCGPGTNAPRFAEVDYVGLDINERYLAIARRRHAGRFICADLQTASLDSLGTFDTILVNSFLHHLPDDGVDRVLGELQRRLAADGTIHVLELVLPGNWSLATLMARLDRGCYPRPLARWRELFAAHFEPTLTQPYFFGGRLWAMVYLQGRRR